MKLLRIIIIFIIGIIIVGCSKYNDELPIIKLTLNEISYDGVIIDTNWISKKGGNSYIANGDPLELIQQSKSIIVDKDSTFKVEIPDVKNTAKISISRFNENNKLEEIKQENPTELKVTTVGESYFVINVTWDETHSVSYGFNIKSK